ncbi:uncharacterized protein A4U43_C05F20810 [Asparagus officinalis]|uniref:Uncharacterized protein n=1 Tax=Asparagus officinalis TaxID=4686 RepID=A0A5P1ETC2_ASPOF|nr:uncharacterized protein A4U43_C05F20810 [Asparagus officinalis]
MGGQSQRSLGEGIREGNGRRRGLSPGADAAGRAAEPWGVFEARGQQGEGWHDVGEVGFRKSTKRYAGSVACLAMGREASWSDLEQEGGCERRGGGWGPTGARELEETLVEEEGIGWWSGGLSLSARAPTRNGQRATL